MGIPGADSPSVDVVVVFAGGDPHPLGVETRLADDAFVIAADSGLEHATRLGRRVDLVVGDLDSVDPAHLDAAIAGGAAVERHAPDKDTTDLELALDAAVDRGASTITVVGGYGGRLDHFLANVAVLASTRYATARLDAYLDRAYVAVVHDEITIDGAPGSLVSLLAVGGRARGVTTAGLRFPLRGADLEPGSTRGVSNELVAPAATVQVSTGTLLVVCPDLVGLRG